MQGNAIHFIFGFLDDDGPATDFERGAATDFARGAAFPPDEALVVFVTSVPCSMALTTDCPPLILFFRIWHT